MAVTLDLPAKALAKLRAEADRRGVGIEVVVTDLVAHIPEDVRARRLGFVGLGSSTSGRTARQADDMLDEGFGRA